VLSFVALLRTQDSALSTGFLKEIVMTPLTALWLPILLSAVFVFIASSIVHMAPLWHRSDYPRLPNEDAVMDALRPLSLPRGDHFMPRAKSGAEMRTPEFKAKIERGPVVLMTVMPGSGMSMTRNFILWFVHLLVIGLFSAYIASRALPPGAPAINVFRFAGATAFIAHVVALWAQAIWYYRSWSMTIKETIDGAIYAVVTAATFAWLWPH